MDAIRLGVWVEAQYAREKRWNPAVNMSLEREVEAQYLLERVDNPRKRSSLQCNVETQYFREHVVNPAKKPRFASCAAPVAAPVAAPLPLISYAMLVEVACGAAKAARDRNLRRLISLEPRFTKNIIFSFLDVSVDRATHAQRVNRRVRAVVDARADLRQLNLAANKARRFLTWEFNYTQRYNRMLRDLRPNAAAFNINGTRHMTMDMANTITAFTAKVRTKAFWEKPLHMRVMCVRDLLSALQPHFKLCRIVCTHGDVSGNKLSFDNAVNFLKGFNALSSTGVPLVIYAGQVEGRGGRSKG